MSDVLIILTNFSRPKNMPRVIQAWRDQTVKCKIIVVDNSPLKPDMCGGQEYYPKDLLTRDVFVNDVWRWTVNAGCPCWFAPAIMLYGHKYVLRADDDFLPGKRAVEHLLATAEKLDNQFSTIGQIGRIMKGSPPEYFRGNVLPYDVPVKVDLTCRVSFMKANAVQWMVIFRNTLLKHASRITAGETDSVKDLARAKHLVGVHDDFLLCMSSQDFGGLPSYIIPLNNDPETLLIKEEIPNGPESCYKRPGHYEERQEMLDLCVKAGWRSLV